MYRSEVKMAAVCEDIISKADEINHAEIKIISLPYSAAGCPKLAIVEFRGVRFFKGLPHYTQLSTIIMHLIIELRHDIVIQCHGNCIEMKKNQLYA